MGNLVMKISQMNMLLKPSGSCILIGMKDAHLVRNKEFKSLVYFKTREGKYDEDVVEAFKQLYLN